MIRRAVRVVVRLGLLVGAALLVSKVIQGRREEAEAPQPPPRSSGGPLTYGPAATVQEATVQEATVQEAAPKPPPPKAEPAIDVADDVVVGRAEAPSQEPWVEPDVAGLCPSSHPVKAKLSSGIYHLPGMMAYTRTRADRCYCDEETAQTDGLRKAKR